MLLYLFVLPLWVLKSSMVSADAGVSDVSNRSARFAPNHVAERQCNGYSSLCSRSYSNVTFVGAHNSPFHQRFNPASNQNHDVVTQLDFGVRLLQLQVHWQNGTIQMCHTSCAILDAGPWVDYLREIRKWMVAHPSEVVTMIIGNADSRAPTDFTGAMNDSGLLEMVYQPPSRSMELDDWPTLGAMIEANTRFVVMLDQRPTDSDSVPWLIDEFEVMWETPFSPTDSNFPCTPQRPPGRPWADRQIRLYLMNHNLNTGVTIDEFSFLVPNVFKINQTNAMTGHGSAGAAVQDCIKEWGRSANVVLVDYAEEGNVPYSVMKVVAQANGVIWHEPQTSDAKPSSYTRGFAVTTLGIGLVLLCI